MHCSISTCPVCAQLQGFKRINAINYKRARHVVFQVPVKPASRPGSPVC